MSNDVKGSSDPVQDLGDLHAAALVGLVLERFRQALAPEAWHGLRVSHFRILESLPPEGARTVDLARSLGMTKQGAGQLVATLADGGWVDQVPDPDDRRARRVVRTRAGDDLVGRRRDETDRIEAGWVAEIGSTDYAVFRDVLTRLASGAT